MFEAYRVGDNGSARQAFVANSIHEQNYAKANLEIATQKKINSVADDTSGFAVGKDLEQKANLSKAAQKNVGAGQDMLSTAESQLVSVKDLITSIRTKIADSTNPATDLSKISGDIKALASEIASIFTNTKYNDTALLVSSSSMSNGNTFTFQTGTEATDTLAINYVTNGQGSLSGVSTVTNAAFTLNNVGTAVAFAVSQSANVGTTSGDIGSLAAFLNTFENTVDQSLADIGNFSQRLTIKDKFLTTAITNSESSYGRLFNANIAESQLKATKAQIGSQLSINVLAQANLQPQNIFGLVRG